MSEPTISGASLPAPDRATPTRGLGYLAPRFGVRRWISTMSVFFDSVIFSDWYAEEASREEGSDQVFESLVEAGRIEFSASPLEEAGCDVGQVLDDALAVAELCVEPAPELARRWEGIGRTQTVFGREDVDDVAERAETLAHPDWSLNARIGLLSGLSAQMSASRGPADVSLCAVAPWTGVNSLLTETLARSTSTLRSRVAECPVVILAPSCDHGDAADYLRQRELWGAAIRAVAIDLADSLWLSMMGCASETDIPGRAQSAASEVFAVVSSSPPRLSVGLGVTVRRIAIEPDTGDPRRLCAGPTYPAAGYDVAVRSMPGA
jgi:hypothetical protein